MSKNESEKANKILDIVSQIIDFNEQNQEGQGLKILTPQQMLSRLSISLAERFKKEIRQLLYYFYR